MVEIPPISRFAGFSADAIDWLEGLIEDTTTEYFDRERAVYEREVLDVGKAFVSAIGEAIFERIGDHVMAEPKVNGSIAPINRDIRFSSDKTPYKDHLHYRFWIAGARGQKKTTRPGFQMRLTPTDVGFLGGVLTFADKVELAAFQRAVDEDGSGEALTAIVADSEAAGLRVGGEGYKRVPKPYPADHPRADLLRFKGLHVVQGLPLPSAVHNAGFVDWCVDRFVPMAPLVDWIVATQIGGISPDV